MGQVFGGNVLNVSQHVERHVVQHKCINSRRQITVGIEQSSEHAEQRRYQ